MVDERKLLERISINPQICSGVPCIKGHRIMVHQILGLLGSGLSPQHICAKWFPTLTLDDVYACIVFANQCVRNEEIHFSEEHGIIVLKIVTAEDADAVHRRLLDALKTIPPRELSGSLLIVDGNKYRLRRTLT